MGRRSQCRGLRSLGSNLHREGCSSPAISRQYFCDAGLSWFNHTAQKPRTTRSFHCVPAGEGIFSKTLAICSMMSLALLSSCSGSDLNRAVCLVPGMVCTDLDVQQKPDLRHCRLSEVLYDIRQSGHGLVRFLERPQPTDIFPIAVDDFLIHPKTPLQSGVLYRISSGFNTFFDDVARNYV